MLHTEKKEGAYVTLPSLRISGYADDSIVDGPGMRFTIFVQGCPHRCPGCHNPETHDFGGGQQVEPNDILARIRANPLLSGVTFSGGEPFCQAKALCALGEQIRAMGKNIVVYSGYTFEELLQLGKSDRYVLSLLQLCDLLVDGRYEESERDLTLSFRGSRNQRLVDLQKMRAEGRLPKI